MSNRNAVALALLLSLTACQRTAQESAPHAGPSGSSSSAAGEAQTLLAVGAPAPDLSGTAQNGKKISLSAWRGRPVVVYFYPKDDTPGCTIEAKEIRDLWRELESTHAVVLGISSDDALSHKAFAEKYLLPFYLLPDTDHAMAKAFGVPLHNGRARRVSFIIGPDGHVARVFPDVHPQGHGQELLQALHALGA